MSALPRANEKDTWPPLVDFEKAEGLAISFAQRERFCYVGSGRRRMPI